MRISFLVIFLLTGMHLFCQKQDKLDTLKNSLTHAKNDSTRFENLNLLIREYLSANMDSAEVYNRRLLRLAKSTEQKSIGIKAYNLASTYYYYNSQLDTCLMLVKKSLSLLKDSDNHKMKSDVYRKLAILSRANSDFDGYESYAKLALEEAKKANDWQLYSSSLLVYGNIYYNKNDYANALKYYLKVDSTHIANNDITSNLSLALENIALIYNELDNDEALIYLDKSKLIHEKLENKAGIYNCIRLKGNYYNNQKDHTKAIDYLTETLPFYDSFGEPNKLVEVYSELVIAYTHSNDLNSAEKFLEKGIAISNKDGFSKFGKNAMHFSAGVFYLKKKDYQKSIYHFIKAENTAPSQGTEYYLRERKEITEGLKEAYKKGGDYKKAFETNDRLLVLKDSLNLMNRERLTTEIEAKYQSEKKEQEIALLRTQNELAEQQKNSQRNLLLGGIGLTSFAGLFLFVLYKNRQKTNIKLREIDALKTNFFTNISHEFRTPLTLISAPIQESLEDETLSGEKRKHFEIAQKSTKKLSSLVDQLLELSKIDAGQRQLIIQKNTPTQMIAAWGESFIYLAQQKNIDLKTEIKDKEVEAWFDCEALENIVVNLLSNAVKYTPDYGEIKLQVSIENNSLAIAIKNTGQGLKSQQIATIFNRFYQTDGQNEGAGVGLSLVKELTELHGGKIKVTSEPHKWTLFEVTLCLDKTKLKNVEIKETANVSPLFSAPYMEQPSHKEEKPPHHKELPILLIVEDNTDVRIVLADTFKKEYRIVQAVNGEEGIVKALDIIPDMIISDVMMPVKDGVALTKNLKNDERTSHIPIILLTAKAGDENELTGIEVGADDYMTKPFNQKILKSKTASLLALRKKLQSRYSQEVILKPKDIAITSIDEKFLDKVQKILDEKLVEPTFSTEQFSKAIYMSRMQLHRKLKALTGLSASEFIKSQRLKLAVQILEKSDINISEVGYSVGFNDHAYFSKCFKEAYNCTPSAFGKEKQPA